MSPSECAFVDVAKALRRIRSRVMPSDVGTITNAIDLLTSVHDFFGGDSLEEDFDDAEEWPGCLIGDPPVHLYIIADGDVSIVAQTRKALAKDKLDELKRRCSLPLDWSKSGGIKVDSIDSGGAPWKPVYSQNGERIGSTLETVTLANLSLSGLLKGGEA